MTRVTRLSFSAAIAIVPVAFLAAAYSQQDPAKPPGVPAPANQPASKADMDDAREMAQLMQHGQLNLRDATSLAEKHVKGTALSARCEIQRESPTRAESKHPGGPSANSQDKPERRASEKQEKAAGATGNRLVYSIACFANDKVQTVIVDGQAKKVIDVAEGRLASAAESAP